jgi:hypothetical protein
VRLTEVGTPVTTTNGQNAELGNDDSSADGGSDFLGGLNSETDVALAVTNDDNGLESGTLTGTGLLLDRLDLLVESYQRCSFVSMNLENLRMIEPGFLNQLSENFVLIPPVLIASA